ncbi:WD40/YVTN/BNR-like repeat-containing protein [Halosolutus amylolyticus]|uniref:WD40/YVTN/BNR-like repeat-containing protein n=1 Tax=Halosolutus amylolyticus TaxID=2932267 RepID=A0ABD5PQZ9_9EURY|nr:hypothetical protein [Halosolutus amylolyticus]
MMIGYVAMRDRLLVCEGDGTDEWETETALQGHDLECVAAASERPDRVFVGTFGNGLRRSTDGGDSFDRVDAGFVGRESAPEGDDASEDVAVMSLAISPHDPDVVYAGTEPSRIYRSTDGGDSWTHLGGLTDLPSASEWYFPPRPHTHHVRWLEVDPFDPDRLWLGIEAGAFVYSTDGGETWTERPPGSRRDNHSLAARPDREGRVYAAAGDGYAESDDGGERWHQPQAGLDHRYCWSVVPDPADPDRVLVSSAAGARTAHTPDRADSHVYRRHGADADWERLDGRGLPTGEGVVRAVFETTDENGDVYGVTNRGLFVTRDFGDRWDRVPIDWADDLETLTPRGLAMLPV